MIDIVGILENYSGTLGWSFSYGNKANNNLLQSNKVENQIYFLLDPVTRTKNKSEFGGNGRISFNGQFLLVVKSNLDNVYHNQKDKVKTDGKYEKNIKPLLTQLELLENELDCSDYQIEEWSIVDAVNALDVNTDGLVVTFRISTL